MTVNIWGTPLDPKSGLPLYPVSGPSKSISKRLKEQAKKARATRKDLELRLGRLTAEFESAFNESDKRDATQRRIADAARSHR